MQLQEIKDKIRSHIEEFILYGESLESDDESLVQTGTIDSSGVMELILFIEDEFNVHIDDGDIAPENIDSVNSLAALIEKSI